MSDDRDKSDFNMAVSYLNRLNFYFWECNEAARSMDAHTWFHTLLVIGRELSSRMKDKEQEAFATAKNTINNKLGTLSKRRYPIQQAGIEPELYDALHDLEIMLRHILKEAGLETKTVSDPRKLM